MVMGADGMLHRPVREDLRDMVTFQQSPEVTE